jgi:hypothetical protein
MGTACEMPDGRELPKRETVPLSFKVLPQPRQVLRMRGKAQGKGRAAGLPAPPWQKVKSGGRKPSAKRFSAVIQLTVSAKGVRWALVELPWMAWSDWMFSLA